MLTLNCHREWIHTLVLLFPLKTNTEKVFSNILSHVQDLSKASVAFPVCSFWGGWSKDTGRDEILLLCVAGRIKIATPSTTNYFSTKTTL